MAAFVSASASAPQALTRRCRRTTIEHCSPGGFFRSRRSRAHRRPCFLAKASSDDSGEGSPPSVSVVFAGDWPSVDIPPASRVSIGTSQVPCLKDKHFEVERKNKSVFVTDTSQGKLQLNGEELFPNVPYIAGPGTCIEALDDDGKSVILTATLELDDADEPPSAATNMLMNAFKGSFAAGANDEVKKRMDEADL